MNWFEQITGFRESDYAGTRSNLAVEGSRLRSRLNGESYAIGDFELVSLASLRERARSAAHPDSRLKVSIVTGDVRHLKQRPEYSGALFQQEVLFSLYQ